MSEGEGVRSVDAVIVGVGFAGMYAIHKLRGMGLSVQAFEQGPELGGTWYWNRYPGARCDVESLDYCYAFDEALLKEWRWKERFTPQPEIMGYIRHVAERFDLRRSVLFNTKIIATHYDDATGCWTVETDAGERWSAQYCISTVGCLSQPNRPQIEGLDDFSGDIHMTSDWPHEKVELVGKRVGVIGTGSSGIQTIPVLAQEAGHLTVFQRTANFTLPCKNGPLDKEYEAQVMADPLAHRRASLKVRAATPNKSTGKATFDVTEEEREASFEWKWNFGGAGGIPVLYTDMLTNKAANDTAADFVRRKIRQIVKDPATAAALSPTDHPIATKRICLDTNYYETFNRPNVSLVDLKKTPIVRMRPEGLETTEKVHPLDVLVLATGFDAMTGALLAMDITGAGGVRLKDVWDNGPRTYLGLMVAGFPNLFIVTGPGSPSVLANVIVAIEQHVDFIAGCLTHMRERGFERVEATDDAQEAWVEEVRRVADGTLFPLANSWYNGDNMPGKPRMFLAYLGGYPAYAAKCKDVVAKGYEGFAFAGQRALSATAS